MNFHLLRMADCPSKKSVHTSSIDVYLASTDIDLFTIEVYFGDHDVDFAQIDVLFTLSRQGMRQKQTRRAPDRLEATGA